MSSALRWRRVRFLFWHVFDGKEKHSGVAAFCFGAFFCANVPNKHVSGMVVCSFDMFFFRNKTIAV